MFQLEIVSFPNLSVFQLKIVNSIRRFRWDYQMMMTIYKLCPMCIPIICYNGWFVFFPHILGGLNVKLICHLSFVIYYFTLSKNTTRRWLNISTSGLSGSPPTQIAIKNKITEKVRRVTLFWLYKCFSHSFCVSQLHSWTKAAKTILSMNIIPKLKYYMSSH